MCPASPFPLPSHLGPQGDLLSSRRLFTQFALSSWGLAPGAQTQAGSWQWWGCAVRTRSCPVPYSTWLPLYFQTQQRCDKGPDRANHGLSPWFVQHRRYAEMNYSLLLYEHSPEANKLANRIFQTILSKKHQASP